MANVKRTKGTILKGFIMTDCDNFKLTMTGKNFNNSWKQIQFLKGPDCIVTYECERLVNEASLVAQMIKCLSSMKEIPV